LRRHTRYKDRAPGRLQLQSCDWLWLCPGHQACVRTWDTLDSNTLSWSTGALSVRCHRFRRVDPFCCTWHRQLFARYCCCSVLDLFPCDGRQDLHWAGLPPALIDILKQEAGGYGWGRLSFTCQTPTQQHSGQGAQASGWAGLYLDTANKV
jgi:hypothetical protein